MREDKGKVRPGTGRGGCEGREGDSQCCMTRKGKGKGGRGEEEKGKRKRKRKGWKRKGWKRKGRKVSKCNDKEGEVEEGGGSSMIIGEIEGGREVEREGEGEGEE